jgi:hypothetical protein
LFLKWNSECEWFFQRLHSRYSCTFLYSCGCCRGDLTLDMIRYWLEWHPNKCGDCQKGPTFCVLDMSMNLFGISAKNHWSPWQCKLLAPYWVGCGVYR